MGPGSATVASRTAWARHVTVKSTRARDGRQIMMMDMSSMPMGMMWGMGLIWLLVVVLLVLGIAAAIKYLRS
jgi:hypothetical protein